VSTAFRNQCEDMMKTRQTRARLKTRIWVLCGTVALSFAAGSLTSAQMIKMRQAQADSDRVFELMIYHTVPGKVRELESLFRDASKLQGKYLNVVGYWVPDEDPAWQNTFIYLVAHSSREAADRNWHAFHADPAFPPYRQAAQPLLEHIGDDYKVDEIYMRASDFSALK
jgi:hypothetical protein